MYAVPNALPAKSAAPTISKAAPIIAICFLLSIAFVIATVIVLSLIPLYMPKKSATLSVANKNYLLSMDFDGTVGEDGEIDATARETIARQLEKSLGLPSGALRITSGTVTTPATKRRKRDFGKFPLSRIRRAGSKRKLIIRFQLDITKCPSCAGGTKVFVNIPVRSIILAFIYKGIQAIITAIADFSTVTETFTSVSTVAPTSTTISTTTTTETTSITTTSQPAAVAFTANPTG